MTDKLSLEEKLIGWLDRQIVFIKRMLNEFPQKARGHLAWTDFDEQNASQIKSLLTPVSEEKRNMLIEQWASEFSIDSRLDYLTAKELLNKAFKAWDKLREGKEG